MCGIFALFCRNYNKKYDLKTLYQNFYKLKHRGPDATREYMVNNNIYFGFHRLAVNDLSEHGMQPFRLGNIFLIANAEIYNHKKLEKEYGFESVLKSTSDCEVILHLYKNFGIKKTCELLDGDFAFTLYDGDKDVLYAARDPIGVRPLFIGYDKKNQGYFLSSEGKGINGLTQDGKLQQFPAASYWSSETPNDFQSYWKIENKSIIKTEIEALKLIKDRLIEATEKRIMSDRPIGCFLSGGLDSSLITALVQKYNPYTINTYSVGMEGGTDFIYANKVAEYLKTNHVEIKFTAKEGIELVEEVIYSLETYDITTIRASVAMYYMSKYIKENSKDIVIFSGEGSDEVTQGYLYFHNAPNSKDSALDSKKLIDNLLYFDVKRVDRTTSAHGLEVRVPFLDKKFITDYFTIDEDLRIPSYKGIEKYLVRKAFDNDKLLPSEVLWRTKEALSDGVSSHEKPWYIILQNFVDTIITDDEYNTNKYKYKNIPITKEAYYYRKIYDKFYPNTDLIPYYWMPMWSNTNDPSARTIGKYKQLIK